MLAHPDFKATLIDEVAIEIAISSPAGQEKEKEKLSVIELNSLSLATSSLRV